jgi:hypothetical protein
MNKCLLFTAAIPLAAAGMLFAGSAAQSAPKSAAKPASAAAPAPAMPPPEKPGPMHEMMKADAGTWDAEVKMSMPGMPASTDKGTRVSRLDASGFWLISDFTSNFMGQPFSGHEIQGYDAMRKRAIYTWVDSTASWMDHGEGDCDPSGKACTYHSRAPDMMRPGKWTDMQSVYERIDADHQRFTMSTRGADGKFAVMMVINYTRRK